MKKLLLITFFLISSCGYQPIYINNNLKNFEFYKISTQGEIEVNRQILNSLMLKENTKNKNLNELFLSSYFNVEEISKNSKGQIKLYKSTINVNLEIKNINNQVMQKRNFAKDFTYNNKQNKFDLAQYQKSNKDDLINKIISDIIIFLNSE